MDRRIINSATLAYLVGERDATQTDLDDFVRAQVNYRQYPCTFGELQIILTHDNQDEDERYRNSAYTDILSIDKDVDLSLPELTKLDFMMMDKFADEDYPIVCDLYLFIDRAPRPVMLIGTDLQLGRALWLIMEDYRLKGFGRLNPTMYEIRALPINENRSLAEYEPPPSSEYASASPSATGGAEP